MNRKNSCSVVEPLVSYVSKNYEHVDEDGTEVNDILTRSSNRLYARTQASSYWLTYSLAGWSAISSDTHATVTAFFVLTVPNSVRWWSARLASGSRFSSKASVKLDDGMLWHVRRYRVDDTKQQSWGDDFLQVLRCMLKLVGWLLDENCLVPTQSRAFLSCLAYPRYQLISEMVPIAYSI